MKITVSIDRVFDNPESKMKASASAAFGGQFVVHNLTIIDGKNGLFVNPPSKQGDDGEYYSIFHPITKDARTQLNNAVLDAYEQKLKDIENGIEEGQNSGDNNQEDSEEATEDDEADFEEIADDGFEVTM